MIGDSPIQLKVCGMRDLSNIREVAQLHPDYMGFIFHPKSPRFVGPDFFLPDDFPKGIEKVGVFVNASLDEMKRQQERLSLDVLQLHGNESPSEVKAAHAMGAKIFKVFSVDDNFDFETVKPYEDYADYFLFDTKGKYYGGNAQLFNWSILQNYDQAIPFLLSGGLNQGNLDEVKKLDGMNLVAVDLNSGVEYEPGIKDVNKIRVVKEKLRKIGFTNY